MSHFAKIDENNIVTEVIVAEQDFINTLPDSSSWIQTSYNTQGGLHLNNGTPLRKNFAGVGYVYDSVMDAFIPPKLFASWLLNKTTCQWEAPIPYPNDGKDYIWDETKKNWVLPNIQG